VNKTAYICSPYRADDDDQFQAQIQYTRHLAKMAVMNGYDVIVPHLYYPQFLNDKVESERNTGMASAINLILKCDILIIGLHHGMSDGMRAEIEFAKENSIPLKKV